MHMQRNLSDWLAYIEQQHPISIAMGLDRVREVAIRMGLGSGKDGKPATHVITVGGTNGKGSAVAFIEAIAREGGYKVGTYTSPHLLRYNERVRIDGFDASDADLIAGFEAVEAARVQRQAQDDQDVSLTYFEYGTLCALWLFERAGLDLVVLEVGLGGRLDAVNIIDADAAVITTVDLDHQDWLGDDIEAIGFEKAGIARPFKPLILGDDDPPASVLRHAYAIGASAWRIGCDFFAEQIDDTHWRWREVGHALDLPMPTLLAPVQLRNAACAIAALQSIDIPIDDAAYARGVAQAQVGGRLQRFNCKGVDVVVDVGHNPQAARALAAWLESQPRRPTRAVYAALKDKDAAGVVAALAGQVDAWHIAGLAEAGSRGEDVEAFARRLQGSAAAAATQHPDVQMALEAAIQRAQPDGRVLVFGSFHTAATALRALNVKS